MSRDIVPQDHCIGFAGSYLAIEPDLPSVGLHYYDDGTARAFLGRVVRGQFVADREVELGDWIRSLTWHWGNKLVDPATGSWQGLPLTDVDWDTLPKTLDAIAPELKQLLLTD